MLNIRKTMTVNGESKIGEKTVVTFSASVPASGNVTCSKTINNRELYLENQEECDSDYKTFEQEVINTLKEE